nr:MAG TPA: hypothetical protein [Caudoviricetes sp.]
MAEAIKMGGGISIPSKEKFYINKNIDESIKVGDPIQFTGDYKEKSKIVYTTNDNTVHGIFRLTEHKYFYMHVIGGYNSVYGCILNTNSDNTDFSWTGTSSLPQTQLQIYGGYWSRVSVLSANLIVIIAKNSSNVLQIAIVKISNSDAITSTVIDVTSNLSDVAFDKHIAIPVKIDSNSFYLIYANKSTPTSLYVRKITVNSDNTLTYSSVIKNLSTNQLVLNQFTKYDVVDNILALATNNTDGTHYGGVIQLDLSNINNCTLSNQVKINTVDTVVYSEQISAVLLSPTKNTVIINGSQYEEGSSYKQHQYLAKLDITNKTTIAMVMRKLFDDTTESLGQIIKVLDNAMILISGVSSGNLGLRYFSYGFITKNNKFHKHKNAVNVYNTNANTYTAYGEYFCEMPANANRGAVFLALWRKEDSGDYSTYADIAEGFTIKSMEDAFDGVALTPGTSGKQIKVLF